LALTAVCGVQIVVVDRRVAFAGGLDLCFGRFDTQSHALVENGGVLWPGIDYYNPRIKVVTRGAVCLRGGK
jgi:hypothetical protein